MLHGQIDFALRKNARPYLESISECPFSVQIGDMGDAETYAELTSMVDATRHRFFGGNHDHYDFLPTYSLGDFGKFCLGGIDFFFHPWSTVK